MVGSYLRFALRTLRRNKVYAFLTIGGLAIGMACCLLLLLFVWHELRVDRFYEHANRLYRVATDETYQGRIQQKATSPIPLAPLLARDFPEVERAVRVDRHASRVVRAGDLRFVEEHTILAADASFFEVFDLPFVAGRPETALSEPYSVVLTEHAARKYFGEADPIGQQLFIDQQSYRVTGLLRDIPFSSHLTFDLLLSRVTRQARYGELADQIDQNWRTNTYTYLLLTETAEPVRLESKLNTYAGTRLDDPELTLRFVLQPVPRIYLHSDRLFEMNTGDRRQLYIFAVLALFILMIACINYVNLATARSSRRAREVGIRKVSGATRSHLIRQYLSESMLISLISLTLALVLVEALLPAFSALVQRNLHFLMLLETAMLQGMAGVALAVGLLAGWYPALSLTRFRPAEVLKGQRLVAARAGLRKALVLVQFAFSVALISATLIVSEQLDFIGSKDLGFVADPVLVLRCRDVETFPAQYDRFKQTLLAHPHVRHVTASTALGVIGAQPSFASEDADLMEAQWIGVDYDYIETLGLRLSAGRGFSRDVTSDARGAFVLNTSAVRALGWEDPVGHPIRFNGREGAVIGVVEDFHTSSLHEPVLPTVLYLVSPRARPFIAVKIDAGDVAGTLAFLNRTWDRFEPDWPFEYSFLSSELDRLYRSEKRFGRFFGYASFLAIGIACLGLFGLASFTAEQRTKELGIRKVLGATAGQITVLLSRGFLQPVCVATGIAVPVVYVMMEQWLQGFAYHIDVSWGPFLLAGLAALVGAGLTVSYHAVRAALAKPVDSLTCE